MRFACALTAAVLAALILWGIWWICHQTHGDFTVALIAWAISGAAQAGWKNGGQ